MLLQARIWKADDSSMYYAASCDDLYIHTQGENLDDAKDMLDDAIQTIFPNMEFNLIWLDKAKGELEVSVKNGEDPKLLAAIKKRMENMK